MKSKKEKILIIKSDKIGDFINFSPCLKTLKNNIKDCHITIICSDYNYTIAKNYDYIDRLIVFKSNYYLLNLILNFKVLFFNKYDYIFQFDGKNRSYLISFFDNISLPLNHAVFFPSLYPHWDLKLSSAANLS